MITYRAGTPQDAEAIAALHARSWREHYRGSLPDAFLDGDVLADRLHVWRERLERPPANQFVQLALDDSALAGFVCAFGAHDPQWGSLIDNLHVAGEAMRHGVGRALMHQAAAGLASRYPDVPVHLWVFEANAQARRFYERLGAHNAGVSPIEVHGSAVPSCRYVWARPESIAAR
jgi:ribosomal protein S18 acetylase RimI-like enzyme